MKTVIKRVLTLALAVVMLSLMMSLVSCSEVESTIETFLSADSYTWTKGNESTVKVSGSTVYRKDATHEVYLYHSEENQCYYYYVKNLVTKGTQKLKIDSEDYIVYRNQVISDVSAMAGRLSSALQILDQLERDGEAYKYQEIAESQFTTTLLVKDGEITQTVQVADLKVVYKVSAIGETEIEIPQSVMTAVAVQ